MCAQPSAEILRVGRAKPRRNGETAGECATLCGDRACRMRETYAKLRLRNPLRRSCASDLCVRNPLRGSCASDARNLNETTIEPGRAQPSAEIVRVGCAVALHFWRKARMKRAFWSSTQTWPVCSTNVVRERAFRSWTQKWPVSLHVVRERALWSWAQTWPVCSTNVVRERAFWSWAQKWPVSLNVVREGAGLRPGQFVVQM